MNKYLDLLVKQFKEAEGINNVDFYSESFVKDFSNWITRNQIIGKDYLSFLDYMFYYEDIFDSKTVEVGKGFLDSVLLNTDATIITPHSECLKQMKSGLIFLSSFNVYNGIPVITDKEGYKSSLGYAFENYITQNPYNIEEIKNWEQLPNMNHSNIVVGVYGSLKDKNKETKIRELRNLREKLDYNYKETYGIVDDSYFYAISNEPRIQGLGKKRV